MAINKVIYDGDTLIDLTSDTVTEETLLVGSKAHGKDGEPIEGACTFDADTKGATANASEILAGQKAYGQGNEIIGTMPNNEGVTGFISDKDEPYTIPLGYHDGSGTVDIDATEKEKLIGANIREGITILGVEGTMSGSEDVKAQEKTVTPTSESQTIVPDPEYNYLSQVTVNAIPYNTSENAAGGTTVTIG